MKGRYEMYNPVIYPRKFFVIRGDKAFVDKHFTNRDGTEIDVDYNDAGAWAHRVKCKDDGLLGVAIWIDSMVTPADLCHEVMHAVNAYVHDLGTRIPSYEEDSYEEFTCYLGGWMFGCVWQFKYGKR